MKDNKTQVSVDQFYSDKINNGIVDLDPTAWEMMDKKLSSNKKKPVFILLRLNKISIIIGVISIIILIASYLHQGDINNQLSSINEVEGIKATPSIESTFKKEKNDVQFQKDEDKPIDNNIIANGDETEVNLQSNRDNEMSIPGRNLNNSIKKSKIDGVENSLAAQDLSNSTFHEILNSESVGKSSNQTYTIYNGRSDQSASSALFDQKKNIENNINEKVSSNEINQENFSGKNKLMSNENELLTTSTLRKTQTSIDRLPLLHSRPLHYKFDFNSDSLNVIPPSQITYRLKPLFIEGAFTATLLENNINDDPSYGFSYSLGYRIKKIRNGSIGLKFNYRYHHKKFLFYLENDGPLSNIRPFVDIEERNPVFILSPFWEYSQAGNRISLLLSSGIGIRYSSFDLTSILVQDNVAEPIGTNSNTVYLKPDFQYHLGGQLRYNILHGVSCFFAADYHRPFTKTRTVNGAFVGYKINPNEFDYQMFEQDILTNKIEDLTISIGLHISLF